MKLDNVTKTYNINFTFYFFTILNHYPFGLKGESVRARWSFQPLAVRVSHLLTSNSRAVLVIWLKPSIQSHGLRLSPSSVVVDASDRHCCIFFIQYLTGMSKIDLTDLLYNTWIILFSFFSTKPVEGDVKIMKKITWALQASAEILYVLLVSELFTATEYLYILKRNANICIF